MSERLEYLRRQFAHMCPLLGSMEGLGGPEMSVLRAAHSAQGGVDGVEGWHSLGGEPAGLRPLRKQQVPFPVLQREFVYRGRAERREPRLLLGGAEG